MSNENMKERLSKLKNKSASPEIKSTQKATITQITHSDAEPDFRNLAAKLKSRKKEEAAKSENYNYVKDTIYIREDIYEAFNSLCLSHGDKKKYTNEALADFIQKKIRDMDIE